jgi:predicted AlkP superfamily pyrophosphatase or phosphodiesterase
MMKKTTTLVLLALQLIYAPILSAQPSSGFKSPGPRLIVVLVFDQFRADYLTRFQSRFLPAQKKDGSPGGFRWLISHGAYFPFAQYDILQSMTGPGHATILSGSYPYQSGIPLNDWYDPATYNRMYCAQDSSVATVGANPKDPFVGTSPKNMIATTVGDELKNAGFPSKVVSIALKDRAAIFMGGHRADLALWLDRESYHWVSSRFYLPEGKLPKWVDELNQDIDQNRGKPIEWNVSGKGTGFTQEGAEAHAPSSFPHRTKVGEMKMGEVDSLASPYGLQLTAKVVSRAVREMGIGKGPATDVLAISFSSHDYVGHRFGPNSREMEEMTIADDQIVSEVLADLKKQIPGGLKDVAFALTADHGIPPQADWAKERGIDAGRVDQATINARLEDRLNAKFGKPKGLKWIPFGWEFNWNIDQRALADRGVKAADVEAEIKDELSKEPWVAHVFTRTDYQHRRLPPGMFERQILHTFYTGRSGDVIAIPKPYYMVKGDNVSHLTSYSYDRTVPLVLSGRFFKTGVYSNRAEVVDLAPTLSFLTGTVPPSLSEGRVLSEALDSGQWMGARAKSGKSSLSEKASIEVTSH